MNSEHVTARCRRHHLRFVYKINGIIFQFLAYVTHGVCVCVCVFRFHVVFSRNNDAYNRLIVVTFMILLFFRFLLIFAGSDTERARS